jgi:hypothetical protein
VKHLLRLLTPGIVGLMVSTGAAQEPRFELVQPDLFAASGGQPN